MRRGCLDKNPVEILHGPAHLSCCSTDSSSSGPSLPLLVSWPCFLRRQVDPVCRFFYMFLRSAKKKFQKKRSAKRNMFLSFFSLYIGKIKLTFTIFLHYFCINYALQMGLQSVGHEGLFG